MVNNSAISQQIEQLPLNSDGQQFHRYQQNDELLLNSDGQQLYHISTKRPIGSKQ